MSHDAYLRQINTILDLYPDTSQGRVLLHSPMMLS